MNLRSKLERVWMDMLGRCSREGKWRSYVCEEWKAFENFFDWAEYRYYKGAHLDKDILGKGQRLYSPDTAAFVTAATNLWFSHGNWAKASFTRRCRVGGYLRYKAVVRKKVIGIYLTEKRAREAAQDYIKDILVDLSAAEQDPRVKQALINFKFPR